MPDRPTRPLTNDRIAAVLDRTGNRQRIRRFRTTGCMHSVVNHTAILEDLVRILIRQAFRCVPS
jgi:hypothetical protein